MTCAPLLNSRKHISRFLVYASEIAAMNKAERLLLIELYQKYFFREYTMLKNGDKPIDEYSLLEGSVVLCSFSIGNYSSYSSSTG